MRHDTDARPAQPHEVIERVERWLQGQQSAAGGASGVLSDEQQLRGEFLSGLVPVLRDLLLYGGQVEDRQISPALDTLKSVFGAAAAAIRELAATAAASDLNVVDQLSELGAVASDVASYQHSMGPESWNAFVSLVDRTASLASKMKLEAIDSVPLGPWTRAAAARRLGELGRLVRDLASRAPADVERGRVHNLQFEASELGRELGELAILGLDRGDAALIEDLASVGRKLHLAEAVVFTFGNIDAFCESLRQAADDIDRIVTIAAAGDGSA